MSAVNKAERERKIKLFLETHGLPDTSLELISAALTHKSYVNEKGSAKASSEVHNQRLEFLGDSVLGMVISEFLYSHYRHLNEGDLTKKKAAIVCEPSLAKVGQSLGLGDMLLMGRGEISTGGSARTSNIADSAEAVIAAIYISLGYEAAKTFVLKNFEPIFTEVEHGSAIKDYKSLLQEHLMKKFKTRPEYEVISEAGPDHDKIFTVSLSIDGVPQCTGDGKNRKSAEQNAARNFIEKNKIRVK